MYSFSPNEIQGSVIIHPLPDGESVIMPPPYKTIKDLPEPVQKVLPVHAQEIFQNAVNAAWEQFEDPKQRLDPRDSREEVAFKVAWVAVEQVCLERFRCSPMEKENLIVFPDTSFSDNSAAPGDFCGT